MIPTMIVFGLAFGRWWKTAILLAAIVWPVILLASDVPQGSPIQRAGTLIFAGLFGALNAAVGVAVHQAVRLLVDALPLAGRFIRRRISRRSARA